MLHIFMPDDRESKKKAEAKKRAAISFPCIVLMLALFIILVIHNGFYNATNVLFGDWFILLYFIGYITKPWK
jgi:hypothetical protein